MYARTRVPTYVQRCNAIQNDAIPQDLAWDVEVPVVLWLEPLVSVDRNMKLHVSDDVALQGGCPTRNVRYTPLELEQDAAGSIKGCHLQAKLVHPLHAARHNVPQELVDTKQLSSRALDFAAVCRLAIGIKHPVQLGCLRTDLGRELPGWVLQVRLHLCPAQPVRLARSEQELDLCRHHSVLQVCVHPIHCGAPGRVNVIPGD